MTDLVEALSADAGVVCVVGAGGKKTTLYRLAADLNRAIVTATVRIPIFDEQVAQVCVTDDPAAAARETATRPLGLVAERERNDRYRGYDPAVVSDLAGAVDDPILVKADGARTRWLKAPKDDEPQLPDATDVVLPIASVRVVGKPLTDEYVHRPELVAAVTGRDLGDRLTASDVAAVLTDEDGGLKGVPADATAIPLLNMVDDADLEATAREIAAEVHARADVPKVVLTSLVAADPVVDVVT